MAQSYQDLIVWQKAMELAEECYRTTRSFPKSELYGMTSQMRRAALSVPSNIAEGYGRGGRREYVHHLCIARGSLKELETQLLLADRVELASRCDLQPGIDLCDEVGRLLNALIQSLARTR